MTTSARRPLHEIVDELVALAGDPDIPDAEVLEALSRLDGDLRTKVAARAAVVKRLEDEATLIEQQRDRLAKRKAARVNRAERLRQDTCAELVRLGATKVDTPEWTVSVRNGQHKLDVVDASLVPLEFWRPQDPVLDRSGILEALRKGVEVKGARLVRGGPSLLIR